MTHVFAMYSVTYTLSALDISNGYKIKREKHKI